MAVMMEHLSFHVELLKMRYFALAGLDWGFQIPATKDMVLLVLEKNGIEKVPFSFERGSPQSYTLSFQTDSYLPEQWLALKQDITEALG